MGHEIVIYIKRPDVLCTSITYKCIITRWFDAYLSVLKFRDIVIICKNQIVRERQCQAVTQETGQDV